MWLLAHDSGIDSGNWSILDCGMRGQGIQPLSLQVQGTCSNTCTKEWLWLYQGAAIRNGGLSRFDCLCKKSSADNCPAASSSTLDLALDFIFQLLRPTSPMPLGSSAPDIGSLFINVDPRMTTPDECRGDVVFAAKE